MSGPLVSYIVPFYNACSGGRQQAWFEACIASIRHQSYENIEIILVDDGSTDQSLAAAVWHMALDRRILITEREKNEGVASALNKGLALSQGALLARLDSDDTACEHRTRSQVEYLQAHQDVGVLGGGMEVLDTVHDTRTLVPPKALHWRSVHELSKTECPFFHPTVMFRREVYEKCGGYPTDYPFAEDYAYWVRVLKHFRGENIPDTLSMVRRHPHRISAQHYTEQQLQAQAISAEAHL